MWGLLPPPPGEGGSDRPTLAQVNAKRNNLQKSARSMFVPTGKIDYTVEHLSIAVQPTSQACNQPVLRAQCGSA